MRKNMLIPLDGSPAAEAALPYAQALATRIGARLTLVRAAHVQQPMAGAADQQRAIDEAEAYLTAQAEALATHGFDVETGVPFGGSTAEWILGEIDLRHADLLVMATHDRVGPDRWVHGSIAEVVVGRALIPILLVRSTHAAQLAQRFGDERPVLVVPLDGSELAEAALPLASELATAFGGQLEFVGVVPGPGDLVAAQGGLMTYVGGDYERLRSDAQEYLAGIVSRLTATGLNAAASVRSGSAAQQIADFAREQSAAAVVMASHGRTGIARSLLGSVAGETLHHSPCPVMLVRPATLRRAEEPAPTQSTGMPSGA